MLEQNIMYRAISGSKRAYNPKIPRFFLTILLVAPIYAGNIYSVDGTIGNDSNPGTQSSPWKTIQRAADMMVAGDSVMVNGGSYGERIHVKTSGSSGNAIT